ncbi:MAG: PTS system mannose/fructose/sorbose family transporter subunit IID [Desulfobulbaceae bacterium]|nr:PTS system mannose/fructose/sorbose family transporter subunit IID [Desulfobulbaceae bacterium]
MLSKISLMASTLGLTVVGAGVDMAPTTPLHVTQTQLATAYSFETVEACNDKIAALYEKNPTLAGKLRCTK